MSNFLNLNKTWMVASIFAATSVFGQSCKPTCEPCCVPHELLQCPTTAGYSAPARIDIQCGWDVWVNASFIYWQALQDNMEPAVSHVPALTTTLGTNSFGIPNLEFKYKPGFKVGLGSSFLYDNWDTSLEYTRLHGKIHKSAAMSAGAASAGDGYYPMWSEPSGTNSLPLYSSKVSAFNAHWMLNLDFLDGDLGRTYYVGTQLTYRPSIGVRAAWIKQHRSCAYKNVLDSTFGINDLEKSHSFGIGPRFSLDTNWMIGDGFRFMANSAFDLLYTRYVRTLHVHDIVANAVALSVFKRQVDISVLRPHLDLELGFAWGTYFDCHKWHFDLSASYGFQIFWRQNMFAFVQGRQSNYGNLYVHGLTLTAKLDF